MTDAPGFYQNILGDVLIGIGIALFIERGSKGSQSSGLSFAELFARARIRGEVATE